MPRNRTHRDRASRDESLDRTQADSEPARGAGPISAFQVEHGTQDGRDRLLERAVLMLYRLLYPLAKSVPVFNVFRYITVRTAMASLSALFLGLVLGPWMVRRLRLLQIGQFIREEGPRSHQAKAGTPTMGGLLIVAATLLPTIFWADLTDAYVLLAIFSMLGFAAIGFSDDYLKVVGKRNRGLAGQTKLFLQIIVSLVAGLAFLIMTVDGIYSTQLIVPFFKRFHPELVFHSLPSLS